MRQVTQLSVAAGLGMAAATAAIGVGFASPAGAECTYSGGATVCAQGDVRGPSGAPDVSGPVYPYPCEYDWLCYDGDVDLVFGGSPPVVNPSPPIDIGRPGRPGIGPR